MRRAVFLDRDGAINRAVIRNGVPHPPTTLEELEVFPGVPQALQRLKGARFDLVVVTNQPDVARGTQTREVVEAIHDYLASILPIDEFRVCYHDDRDACPCRKPKPGLLTRAPLYNVSRSYMVGDRWRDVEAGSRAGCRASILIESEAGEPLTVPPDARVASLVDAVDWILQQDGSGRYE